MQLTSCAEGPHLAEAWVTKGPKQLKRVEPKGRGRMGLRVHPDSKLSVVLREGKTVSELKEEDRRKRLKRVVSMVVEDDIEKLLQRNGRVRGRNHLNDV